MKLIIIGAVLITALILFFIHRKNQTIITVATSTDNKYEILVDVEESILYLINNNGQIEKQYMCSGGKWSTPSPIGTWKIIEKATWGEGFRGTLDGFKCSMGEIWNTWNTRSKFSWMGKLTWLYKNE